MAQVMLCRMVRDYGTSDAVQDGKGHGTSNAVQHVEEPWYKGCWAGCWGTRVHVILLCRMAGTDMDPPTSPTDTHK